MRPWLPNRRKMMPRAARPRGKRRNGWLTSAERLEDRRLLALTVTGEYPGTGPASVASDAVLNESTLVAGVTSLNSAPTDISLFGTSVPENAAVGAAVGSLSTADPDSADTFTYALVSGEVVVPATGTPHSIPDLGEMISNLDVGGRASSIPLSSIKLDLDITHTWRGDLVVTLQAPSGEIITITDRNEGSTGDRQDLVVSSMALNATQFGGNNATINPNGTWILRVVDAAQDDVGTLNSWALRFSDGDDNASFTIDGDTLEAAAVYDFEAKSSYAIRIRSTDAGGLSTEKSFTISVTNVNEAPTDLFLSTTSVAADAGVGTSVGSLSTTDPDIGDTFTYTFATGAGDTDNASFTIEGSTIKTTTVFDVQAKDSYSIRVRSTDAGGLLTEKALTIRVIAQVVSEADIPLALDSDGDGVANVIDTDDDNDGTLDNDDGQPLNAASSGPLTESVTVVASADAALLGNSTSNANTNYGSAATAQTRNGSRGLLMKFSLPADGVLQSVTLNVFTSTENDPLDVYLVADNSWTEGGVTYNTANWENSAFLGTTDSPSGGVYSFTLPQHAALSAGETVSLYVEDPDDPSGSVEALFTKETAGKAPSLLIEKSDVSPLEITFSDQEVYRTDGSFSVRVSMRSAPAGTVYAPFAVSDPSVASIVGASVVTFTAENWATPQTVQIAAADVGNFTLLARPLHSDDPGFNGINPEDVTGFKVTAIDLAAGTAVEATTGEILSQNLQPTSAVGSTYFRWQLISGPQGLNVVENTGRLTFRPTSDQAGLNTTAVLQATDEFGNTARFEIPVTVSSGVNLDPTGIYVVPGIGSNSTGDGTAANPYGTIAYGIERANATGSSTVFIRGGEYSFGSSKQTITTAAGSEIMVKPLPGEHVKLNFSGFTGFDITSTARNITIEGFEIDGGSDAADFWDIVSVGFWTPDLISRGGGIAFNVDGQFITIRDNYIHDAYQKAVEIKDGRYVTVDGNIIRHIATTSLSGGHGIMRQQKGAEFFDDDLPDELRWDITGNMIFNVEQRIYSWVPSKGFIEMVLDEGKPILIDDPKDTNGSQEQMAARISNNIVAYGAIDGIRLKSTPNLEVSNNSVFSQASLADGVTDRDGDTSTPKFTDFKFTNNAVKVTPSRFAVEIDDAVADAGAGAVVSGNVVGGGLLKPSGQSGITNLGNVELFTDAINGDFSINPELGLSGVGVAPAILSELDARVTAFGVEIGWDRWDIDHLKLTQTILDNIPGVNDGVAGNEIAFTDQGTFNTARTTIEFSTVNGSWKTDRGAASTMDFHLNDDYSAWYTSIENSYKQTDGSNYSRIRWGDSVFAQDQVLAADGLLVSKVDGSGSSTQIEAAGHTVTLGGNLLVDLTDYDPANGSVFDLIVAGQLAANFDNVLIKQPGSTYSAHVTLVDTDTDTVPDTVRLTVGGTDSNNAPTGSVTISGAAIQGETLTAANDLVDADGLGTVTYTWKADGDELGTGAEYVLTQSEVGRSITVTARYIDQAGNAESVVSDPTGPVENVNDLPTGTVSITGLAMVARTLVATNDLADADGLGTLGYQWKADGTAIGGATASSYTLTTEELGKVISVTISYTDGGGELESVTSGNTDPVVENSSTLVLTAADLDRSTTLYQAGETIATLEGAGVTVMIGGDDYEIVGNEVRLKRDVAVSLASPLPMLAVTDGQDTRFLISKHFGVTADLEVGQLSGTSRVRDLTTIVLRSNDATGATYSGGYFKVDLSSLQLSPDDVLANADFNAFVDGSGSSATAGPVRLYGLADTAWGETSSVAYSWPYTASSPLVGDTLAAGLSADYGTVSATLATGQLLRFNLDASATSGVRAFLMLSGESNTNRRYIFASESASPPYVSVSYVTESPLVAANAAVSVAEGGNTIASPLALISAGALPTGATDVGIESVGGTSWTSLPLSTHATFTHEAGYREAAGTHGTLYVARDGTAFYQHDGSDLPADATDTFAFRFTATIDGAHVGSSVGEVSVTTTAGNQAPLIAASLNHVVKQGSDYAVVDPQTGAETAFSSGDPLVVARLTLSDPDGDLVQPQWTNGSSPTDGDGAAIYELDTSNLQVLLTAAGKAWTAAGNDLPALTLAAVDDSDTATNYALVKVHPVVAHGRSVYVSMAGDGSQDGSSPANTVALDTALQRETANRSQYLLPGDTVFLVGTFENPSFQQSFSFDGATAAEVANANIWHDERTVNVLQINGEYGLPITFTGYNDSTLLKGDGAAVIEVKGSRYIRVMNLEVQGQVGDPTRPGEGISLETAQKLQMLYRVDKPDNTANGNRFGDIVHYTNGTDSYYFRVYTDTAVGLGLAKPAGAETWTFDDLLHHAEAYDASDSATWMFDISAAAEAAGATVSRPSIIDTKGINVHSSYGVDVIGTRVHHIPGTGIQSYYGAYLNFQDNEVSHASRLSYTGTHGMQFYYIGEDNAGIFPASDPYAADPDTAFNIDAEHDYKIMVVGNDVHHNYNGQFSWNATKLFVEPKLDEGKGLSPQFGDPRNKDTGSNAWSQDNDRFLLANNVAYLNGLAGIHNHETSRVDIVGNTAYLNHLYLNVFRVPYVSNQVGITHQGGSDVSIQNNIAVISDLMVDGTPTGSGPMNATNGTYALEIRATANLLWSLDGSVEADAVLTDPSVNTIANSVLIADSPPGFLAESALNFGVTEESAAIGRGVPWNGQLVADKAGVLRGASTDLGAFQHVAFSFIGGPVEIPVTVGETVIDQTIRSGSEQIRKQGGGTLVLDQPNTHSGGTSVLSGALIVRNVAALGSGPLEIANGARVTLDVGSGRIALSQLTIAAGGTLDLGEGSVVAAAGTYDLSAIQTLIASARSGGTWTGSGLTSGSAQANPYRAVGHRVLDDGSLLIGYAGIGDATLDGVVDVRDLILLNSGRKFGASVANTGWWEGDFDFDGRFDVRDLISLSASRLYGTGTYQQASLSASVTAAPPSAGTAVAASTSASALEMAIEASDPTGQADATGGPVAPATEVASPDKAAWAAYSEGFISQPTGDSKSPRWRLLRRGNIA